MLFQKASRKYKTMKEVILCKYGELVLKGANKSHFEAMLVRRIKGRATRYGDFKVYNRQSTVYVEPLDEFCDMDGMLESMTKMFGFNRVTVAAVCEKNMESICECVKEYLPHRMEGVKTFKVEAKRADKTFPLKSPELCAEVGAYILESVRGIRVNVQNPERVVRVEIREAGAYIHFDALAGAGGMPIGSSGRGLLLLSGGIDSPVAGYMMAKRGMTVDALHFESFPHTSERAKEKVLTLAKEVTEYTDCMYVHIISLTHIQEEIKNKCDEDYFTLLLRRFMYVLSERMAKKCYCGALITGESLGQVASQTLEAIGVTDAMVNIPVFRPCIGLDKEEIVQIARKIGTFETSILPYEDCCTVFTPRHPKTRPNPDYVAAEAAKLDFDALCDEAFESMYTVKVTPDGFEEYDAK